MRGIMLKGLTISFRSWRIEERGRQLLEESSGWEGLNEVIETGWRVGEGC